MDSVHSKVNLSLLDYIEARMGADDPSGVYSLNIYVISSNLSVESNQGTGYSDFEVLHFGLRVWFINVCVF